MTISADTLDLVILADAHYVRQADHTCPVASRNPDLGLDLIWRAMDRATHECRPAAVVVMGDLVDNGLASGADDDLVALRDVLAGFELPMLVVPGNHDGDAERMLAIFGDRPGVHEVGGWQLVTCVDAYAEGDFCTRSPADLRLPAEAAARGPVAVFQHNPIWPDIVSSYPYMPTNVDAIRASYAEAGVALSVSGHYHPGTPVAWHDGTGYVTCPALCEAPFRLLHVRLCRPSKAVEVREIALELPTSPRLVDVHCHTHYAYCATTVRAHGAVAWARKMGLAGIVITEHAGQLYVPAEDFWSARFLAEPDLPARNRQAGTDRMRAYREEIDPMRSPYVRLGMEVEVDCNGSLTLLPEDREGLDLLIGAVHWLPAIDAKTAGRAEMVAEFLRASEQLVASGIDVLAHPLRWFRRTGAPCPDEVHRPLARMLADAGVAAEVNYHTNDPDPRFFACCLEHGVKLALGSDAHRIEEVGAFGPHLRLLRRAGVRGDPRDVLFRF